MGRQIAAPRGTRDILPEEAAAWARLEGLARDLAGRYALERIDTPLFEDSRLFARGLGESSDAVEKEMFRVSAVPGAGEEAWALRPEPTAGIVRAYLEHGMHVRPGPVRLWLLGPMFRHDRPQAGRYRQFSQWDVEVLGDPGPMVDAELVELAHRFYAEAGLAGVTARLNSIGDGACRPAYRETLVAYLAAHEERLSADSRRRLRVNPLRVLDDKGLDPAVAEGAPRAVDHLCGPCAEHFAAVRDLLDRLGLRHELDHRLVRGLDYYTRTTFEFFVAGREGQQQALGGGGRYDGLVQLLGGRPTPGIGFGIGLDRTVLALAEQGIEPPAPAPLVGVIGGDEAGAAERLGAARILREAGLRVRAEAPGRRLGRQLDSAARHGARWALIVGAGADAVLRDLERGDQRSVTIGEAVDLIRGTAEGGPPTG